jgi:hypothetical protein
MHYAPPGFPLLKQLLPPPVQRAARLSALQVFQREAKGISGLLNQSYRRGLMSNEQMEDVHKDLRAIGDVLADLEKREAKLRRAQLTESVPLDQMGDTSLRFLLDRDWAKVSPYVEEYLQKVRALLDRLLAYNHLNAPGHRAVQAYFDKLREIHGIVMRYASSLYE